MTDPTVSGSALAAELQGALQQMARARQALANDDIEGLVAVLPFVDSLSARLLALAPSVPIRSDPKLLALLDETQTMIGKLSREQQQLQARLRSSNSHRSAGSAYSQTQRL